MTTGIHRSAKFDLYKYNRIAAKNNSMLLTIKENRFNI